MISYYIIKILLILVHCMNLCRRFNLDTGVCGLRAVHCHSEQHRDVLDRVALRRLVIATFLCLCFMLAEFIGAHWFTSLHSSGPFTTRCSQHIVCAHAHCTMNKYIYMYMYSTLRTYCTCYLVPVRVDFACCVVRWRRVIIVPHR